MRILTLLTLLFLLFVAFPEDNIRKILSTPVENGDINFLRALNNYFGCKTWIDGQCIQCSAHYVFNDNKICSEVTPQCKKFNRAVGICEECYLGYQIYNGQCILTKLAQSIDRGCKSFQNGKCKDCSIRWYFDENRECQPVDDSCRKWEKNGKCLGCYTGYHLEEGTCELSSGKLSNIDTFCAQWENLECKKCADRAYFGPIGLCIPISDYCRTWDTFDGYCLTCYKGYDLQEGKCIESKLNSISPTDLGCKNWDWQDQVCLQCSQRWVFDKDGVCVPVSDDCRHYNKEGECVQCYKGYQLNEGNCVFSEDNQKGPSDIGCKLWDWHKQVCLQCSDRWSFDKSRICRPVSDQCRSYDSEGKCTSCYPGYDLSSGVCIVSPLNNLQPKDPGCKVWDWESDKCIQCSFRWYFGEDGKCKKVSDICKDYNDQGHCTQCYEGYQVKDRSCEVVKNDFCAKKQFGYCVLCYEGYRLLTGKCIPSNPLCKTSNEIGSCTSCFTTYVLYKKICVPLVKLVNLASYYAECCPEKLQQLKKEGRII